MSVTITEHLPRQLSWLTRGIADDPTAPTRMADADALATPARRVRQHQRRVLLAARDATAAVLESSTLESAAPLRRKKRAA